MSISANYGPPADRNQGINVIRTARALVTITGQVPPPRRFIAGADAIATAEQKITDLQAQFASYRELPTSLEDEAAAVSK